MKLLARWKAPQPKASVERYLRKRWQSEHRKYIPVFVWGFWIYGGDDVSSVCDAMHLSATRPMPRVEKLDLSNEVTAYDLVQFIEITRDFHRNRICFLCPEGRSYYVSVHWMHCMHQHKKRTKTKRQEITLPHLWFHIGSLCKWTESVQ